METGKKYFMIGKIIKHVPIFIFLFWWRIHTFHSIKHIWKVVTKQWLQSYFDLDQNSSFQARKIQSFPNHI